VRLAHLSDPPSVGYSIVDSAATEYYDLSIFFIVVSRFRWESISLWWMTWRAQISKAKGLIRQTIDHHSYGQEPIYAA